MTSEEMERAMQFILEQQAQLTATVDKLAAKVDRIEESQANTTRQIEESQANTARQIEHLGSALVALTEAHTRTEESLTQLAQAQTQLAQAQTHSDQRLDALIDIVQGGRGGKS